MIKGLPSKVSCSQKHKNSSRNIAEVRLLKDKRIRIKDKMSADALKTKLDQYLRPENVEGLRTPKVNPLIWNQISASMRTQDSGSIYCGGSISSIK